MGGGQLPLPLLNVNSDQNGYATTSIPLTVPEGTKGLTPQLGFSYNSGFGRGLLGRGWLLLGVTFIKRDLNYGINYTSSDRFISSEHGQLINSLGNRSVYYSKEESFVSFYPQGDAGQGPTGFIAYDKEGTRFTYGGTSAQLTGPNGAIRTWGLAEVKEAHGETIQYEWMENAGELYPSKITYAGGKRYIQFDYEGRPDTFSDYSEKVHTYKQLRLSRVLFYSDNSLVHSYTMSYGNDPGTGDSLLTKVEFKKDTLFSLSTHLPLEFSYTPSHSGLITKLSVGATPLSNGFGEEIDMVDRGFQKFKELVLALAIKKLWNAGKIETPYAIRAFNASDPSKESSIKTDLYEVSAMDIAENRYNPDVDYIGRYPLGNRNRDMCNWGPLSCLCTAFPGCPGEVILYCGVYLTFGQDGCNNGFLSSSRTNFPTDIDGDGVPEYSRFLGKMDGDQVYVRTQEFVNSKRSYDSPKFPIKYNTFYQWADIDGDGKTDFLYEKSGILHISFSNGSGLEYTIAYSNILLSPAAQNYSRTSLYDPRDYVADINSDGRGDFVHFYDDRMSVYLSQGRSFQAEKVFWYGGIRKPVYETKNTNPFIAHRINQFADIDGDGIPEHLHIVNVNPPPEQAQLAAMKSRHSAELAAADSERQTYKDQIWHVITGGPADDGVKNALSLKIHSDERGLYWSLIGNPENTTIEYRDILFKSVDRVFSEEKLKEVYDRQANELNDEITRIKNVNLDGAIYHLIITKIFLSENRLEQSAQVLPKEIVGYIGKNWLVDVTRDGLPDLVTLTNRNSHFNPYDYGTENPGTFTNQLKVIINTGGSFNTGSVITSNIPTVIKPDRFAEKDDPNAKKIQIFDFVDMDSDGVLDFTLSQLDSTTFQTYFGQSNGSFAQRTGGSFQVESSELTSIQFDDRNEDGIPDLFYQYGKTEKAREILSESSIKGGLLKRVVNGVSGAETVVNYSWKKAIPGAALKGTGNYDSGLPNWYPQMMVTSAYSTKGMGFPVESTDYFYSNARHKPGDLETGVSLGFETITERNYLSGSFVGRVVTNYIQNTTFPGKISSREIYAGNDSLIQRDSYAYTYYTPHNGTKLKLPTTTTTLIYENGAIKDQKSQSITYLSAYAYEPGVIEDTWNGRTTRREISYQSNSGLNILAQSTEEKTYIDGSLVEHSKLSYSGADIVTRSELVGNGEWYTTIYTYDGTGNINSTTDSLGRSLSYEYNDLTRSKQTILRNALGQTTTTNYDPKTDLEVLVEDSNGNKEELEYDTYGRKTKTIVNGDTLESYDYIFDGSLFITTKTTYTAEGDVWIKETKNILDQTIKTESLAADGYSFTEESKFDQKGREIQKSNRYLTGESPVWTLTSYYQANEDTSERPKQMVFYTGEIVNFSYGLRNVTTNTTYQSENIRSEISTTDEFGQLVTKVIQGETLRFSYNSQGKITQIIDPGNATTTIQYDLGGRKISQTDSNSGTTIYTYNVAGEMLTQKDSRGILHRYEIDHLGRITKLIAGSETPVSYEYDHSNSIAMTNMVGRLSKVTDETGIAEFAYDNKGNVIAEKRTLDDLQVIFQKTYDAFNRVKTIKYPEGTIVRSHYTGTGQLGFLTMDSHDGNSLNHTVVSYDGPKKENGQHYIERKTGNGILTKIEIDPVRLRPRAFYTKLKDGSLEQSVSYNYDNKGNLSSIQDNMNETRNQSFVYDQLNRITKAIGKYGEEEYDYHKNGNLLKKGAFTYSYDNPNHIHSVTKANSLNTGILGYSYDEAGNMVQRNGDNYYYNAQGKLREIVTSGGDRFEYKYDYSGNRIRKSLLNLGTVTYDFGNIYEIYRSPGLPDKHTMFIVGTEGDLVAQYSRDDANLIGSIASNELLNPFCKGVEIDCGTYWKNRIGFNFITLLSDTNIYVDGKLREGHKAIPWILLTISLVVFVYRTGNKDTSGRSTFQNAEISKEFLGISFLPGSFVSFSKQFPRYLTSLLIVIFSFTTTTGCFPLLMGGGEGESGTPIWLLGMTGVPATTQSVAEESNASGGGGGSSTTGNARVAGMYFYHPDHLGSISMITDGNGNVLAGGERGGKSHITYKPYGEILRTDSYGPDITKFKYTGQEEDRETGLYYYKARYYDPALGRFLTNDSMIFPKQIQGLNRSMYVEGNPIGNRDPGGNKPIKPLTWAIAGYLLAPDGQKSEYATLLYYLADQKREQNRRKEFWLDRQIVNPIMRMNTTQFILGVIGIAAGFYTSAYLNEAIGKKCEGQFGTGFNMSEAGPREMCGLIVGGGTSLIIRTVTRSLVKETAKMIGDGKNVEKYLNAFSNGYYTGGILSNIIKVPLGGIGNISDFKNYTIDVDKLTTWYTYPVAGASYFLGKELDKVMRQHGIQQ